MLLTMYGCGKSACGKHARLYSSNQGRKKQHLQPFFTGSSLRQPPVNIAFALAVFLSQPKYANYTSGFRKETASVNHLLWQFLAWAHIYIFVPAPAPYELSVKKMLASGKIDSVLIKCKNRVQSVQKIVLYENSSCWKRSFRLYRVVGFLHFG